MKTARIAIFLTGMIGLGMGGLMSLSGIQSQQEEAALRANDALKTQAQAYVDQFFSVIDGIRSGGNPEYVLNQYSVKMNQGIASEIESSKKDTPKNTNPLNNVIKAGTENIDLALEDRLLRALKNQVTLNDLQLSKYAVGTFDLSEVGSKEGIFVATPSESEGRNISRINVTLIDPTAALTSFPKLNNSKSDRHAYLINRNGKVLAHTASAYVGTDLRKAEGLRHTVENLFVGAQTGSVTQYRSMDGTKEQVAFVRAGTLPFAVGVEQRAIPPVLTLTWFEDVMSSGAARKALGMIVIVMAASIALFSAVSMAFNRRIQKEIKLSKFQSRHQNPERTADRTVNEPKIAPPKEIQKAAEEFVVAQGQIEGESRQLNQANAALSQIAVHRDYAEELAARVKGAQTPEAIEKLLTGLSSEMSESATLFFRYDRRLQNLTLGSVAGNVQIPNTQLLQAYVRKDIEEQVEGFATEGKVASLNNYGPVGKMINANLNVAHFEAWAVCSEAEVSGKPKLVGVLVILNAGFRSAQSRPVLSRMLRESGNYLYAQTNKVSRRPRATPTPSVNASHLNPSSLNS